MLKIDELLKHHCTANEDNYMGVTLYYKCDIIITIMKILVLAAPPEAAATTAAAAVVKYIIISY